jgi:ribosome-associated protein
MLVVNQRIRVPLREFDFSFARSSGPGGQNVNKVNTKVTLSWCVSSSPSLDEAVKKRFIERYHNRINRDGQLLVTSQRFRDQGRNVGDCLEKLRAMIQSVAAAPRARKPTRPTRASRLRRRVAKDSLSRKKQLRQRPARDEDG